MMTSHRPVIVGAGPAGVRAAQALARAGLRPLVLDEAPRAGGQIYRQPPAGVQRSGRALYGFEHRKARAVHEAMAALIDAGHVDYLPGALVWNCEDGVLDVLHEGVSHAVPYSHLILATGATDRVLPFPGWLTPGVYSLGGAQVALKFQGCAIGKRVVFMGTGPLLYLVAYQYAKAGAEVAAVLDTAAPRDRRAALPGLLAAPGLLAKGLYYMAWLRLHGVPLYGGVRPLRAVGTSKLTALVCRVGGGVTPRAPRGGQRVADNGAAGSAIGNVSSSGIAKVGSSVGNAVGNNVSSSVSNHVGNSVSNGVGNNVSNDVSDDVTNKAGNSGAADDVATAKDVTYENAVDENTDGRILEIPCDALAFGLALRAETQLASLAGCDFRFDARDRNWLPVRDGVGRTSVQGVYVAGDGAGIAGADAAELAGELAALALLQDAGLPADARRMDWLTGALGRWQRIRNALEKAFPFPVDWAESLDDAVPLCRCEEISTGELRAAAREAGAAELNRAKALTRVGMGRCQGRMCGLAAAEVLAAVHGAGPEQAGRLRPQPPVKPVPVHMRFAEPGQALPDALVRRCAIAPMTHARMVAAEPRPPGPARVRGPRQGAAGAAAVAAAGGRSERGAWMAGSKVQP